MEEVTRGGLYPSISNVCLTQTRALIALSLPFADVYPGCCGLPCKDVSRFGTDEHAVRHAMTTSFARPFSDQTLASSNMFSSSTSTPGATYNQIPSAAQTHMLPHSPNQFIDQRNQHNGVAHYEARVNVSTPSFHAWDGPGTLLNADDCPLGALVSPMQNSTVVSGNGYLEHDVEAFATSK